MAYFWIRFSDRRNGTVSATNMDEAMELAKSHGKPMYVVGRLDYPAAPALHNPGGCPAFCYRPNDCARVGRCWPNSHGGRSCSS